MAKHSCPNRECGYDAPAGQIRHEQQIKVDAVRSWFEPCTFCDGKGEAEADCGDCLDSGELPNGKACSACCSHSDLDCGHCQDCGKDCSEDLMARAEFAAECLEDR